MSIGSVGASSTLTQLFATQQAQAASSTAQADSDPSDPVASDGNLTGSTTASLDSQTLSVLLGLTQQDPTEGSPDQTQGTQGTQGAHRHHHHHGGGAPSSASSTADASTTGDPATAAGTSTAVGTAAAAAA